MILNAYIADIENILIFASQLLWFGTPIFYAIESQQNLFYLNLLNPLYYFIEGARSLILYDGVFYTWIFIGSVFFSTITIMLGISIYNALHKKIPELL